MRDVTIHLSDDVRAKIHKWQDRLILAGCLLAGVFLFYITR